MTNKTKIIGVAIITMFIFFYALNAKDINVNLGADQIDLKIAQIIQTENSYYSSYGKYSKIAPVIIGDTKIQAYEFKDWQDNIGYLILMEKTDAEGVVWKKKTYIGSKENESVDWYIASQIK